MDIGRGILWSDLGSRPWELMRQPLVCFFFEFRVSGLGFRPPLCFFWI